MTLNSKIAYCRKKAGMSQEELGEVIGVSRQAISKWETGESTPEVGKLLLLAKAFGVTTDWLLSDEEPILEKEEEEPQVNENPYYHKTMDDIGGTPDWIDNLPRSLGRLIKRFSWLLGVYVAVIGLIFSIFGGVVMLAANYMVSSMSETTKVAVNYADVPFDGFGIEDEIFFDRYEDMVNNMTETGKAVNNPVTFIAVIMIVIGVVMMIGGVILAVVLKRYGREHK